MPTAEEEKRNLNDAELLSGLLTEEEETSDSDLSVALLWR